MGKVTAKDIEQMFMNLLGANVWRWTARPTSDSSYVMRFPTPEMVQQWSQVNVMTLKGGSATIQIQPWSSRNGSKGELQQGWFRVSNIPDDQRALVTIAKVGGLVGKVMEIDEKTRYRLDYVRMKIACRDLSKVPKSAEGALGINLYDFEFVREVEDENKEKTLKSGVVVSHDPATKTGDGAGSSQSMGGPRSEKDSAQDKFDGKKGGSASAPPKYRFYKDKIPVLEGSKVSKVVALSEKECDKLGILYIPETCEALTSDSDSDSLGENLKILNVDQAAENQEQIWKALEEEKMKETENLLPDTHNEEVTISVIQQVEDNTAVEVSKSPEIFIPDDGIAMEQDNQSPCVTVAVASHATQPDMKDQKVVCQEQMGGNPKMTKEQIPARRRSERLLKTVTLTTQEKAQEMAKKRNLEGLQKEENRDALVQGVETMLQIATQILAKKQRTEGSPARIANMDADDDGADA